MTAYPNTLATLADNKADSTPTAGDHAAHHDSLADEVVAIETELGVLPKGGYANVRTRLDNTLINAPAADQVITPTGDFTGIAVRASSLQNTHPLIAVQNVSGVTVGFWDRLGNLSALTLSVAGVALASQHLSDGKAIQKKSQLHSFSRIPGVTPGLAGNPQTVLQVTANNTWTLAIAAGSALIQGTDNATQGMYAVTSGAASLVLPTQAPLSNPRVDAIVVQYNDSLWSGRTPADNFSFVQVVGTETPGATLGNLNGHPATPASSLLLAYILSNPGGSGVSVGNVLDQRILEGPGIWGEDGHRYRLSVDANGNLFLGQVL